MDQDVDYLLNKLGNQQFWYYNRFGKGQEYVVSVLLNEIENCL